jgi:hypothetical protein
MYALALIKHAFMHPQTALHNLGVIGVVKLQRLSESEDVLLTAVSGQRGQRSPARMAASITMVGKDGRNCPPATTARMIRIPVSPVMSVTRSRASP